MPYGYASYDMMSVIVTIIVVIFAFSVMGKRADCAQKQRQDKRRRSVLDGNLVSAREFLANWRVGRRGSGLGYASLDRSGCYVILTNPVIPTTPSASNDGRIRYEAVYVGQSMHVCSRVHAHLTGHGNGDVYADVRAEKDVMVSIVACDEREMNDVERNLIALFHATDSYNKTRGGSRRR